MNHLSAANRTTNPTDCPDIEADTRTFGHIVNDGLGCCVDRVQGVTSFDQNTRAELAGWCTNTSHDRRWKTELACAGVFIELLDHIQAAFFVPVGEQRHGDCHVHDLRSFVEDLAILLGTVTQQILLCQLAHGRPGEVLVTFVVDDIVQLVELFSRVKVEELTIIHALLDVLDEDIQQVRWLVLAIDSLAQII